jgi:CYTH domain-containing protein/predicted ATPase
MHHDTPRILVTGGPCSGKTTGLAQVAEWLVEIGYTPIIVPESATTLILAGQKPGGTPAERSAFQRQVLELQMQNESMYRDKARRLPASAKAVLLFDRGMLDGAIYLDETPFSEILSELGLTRTSILQGYSHVLHLQSAAVGAEAFYTSANNAARYESLEHAQEVEARTIRTYLDHSHLRVIENGPGGFDAKMHRFKAHIAHAIGIPEPLEIERKFLVDRARLVLPVPVQHVIPLIEQHYVLDEHDTPCRVRRTTLADGRIHTKTYKTFVSPGISVEHERVITDTEYRQATRSPAPSISKARVAFLWNYRYFELDLFDAPNDSLALLEVEVIDMAEHIELPPWIPILREVTGERAFTNASIAGAG